MTCVLEQPRPEASGQTGSGHNVESNVLCWDKAGAEPNTARFERRVVCYQGWSHVKEQLQMRYNKP